MNALFFDMLEWFVELFERTQRTFTTRTISFFAEAGLLGVLGVLHVIAQDRGDDQTFALTVLMRTVVGLLGAVLGLVGVAMLRASYETGFHWRRHHPGLMSVLFGGYVFLRAVGLPSQLRKDD